MNKHFKITLLVSLLMGFSNFSHAAFSMRSSPSRSFSSLSHSSSFKEEGESNSYMSHNSFKEDSAEEEKPKNNTYTEETEENTETHETHSSVTQEEEEKPPVNEEDMKKQKLPSVNQVKNKVEPNKKNNNAQSSNMQLNNNKYFIYYLQGNKDSYITYQNKYGYNPFFSNYLFHYSLMPNYFGQLKMYFEPSYTHQVNENAEKYDNKTLSEAEWNQTITKTNNYMKNFGSMNVKQLLKKAESECNDKKYVCVSAPSQKDKVSLMFSKALYEGIKAVSENIKVPDFDINNKSQSLVFEVFNNDLYKHQEDIYKITSTMVGDKSLIQSTKDGYFVGYAVGLYIVKNHLK